MRILSRPSFPFVPSTMTDPRENLSEAEAMRLWQKAAQLQAEEAPLAEARAADEAILALWAEGDHAAVIDGYDEYRQFAPEAFFAHYLMLVGALGGRACTAPGVRYSDYEASAGTGQVHVWFPRPQAGWTA